MVRIVLLGLFVGHLSLRGRNSFLAKHNRHALLIFAAVSLLAHVNFLEFHSDGEHVHDREFYHYYVGSKYFAELGYTQLYEATVVANREDDPEGYNPRGGVRDLTNKLKSVGNRNIIGRAARIKQRFSPERWQEFKRDIAVFRSYNKALWRTSLFLSDHGYNGTPVTTAILGSLANHHPGSSASFVNVMAAMDLVLILVLALLIARLLSFEIALSFLFLWCVNPFNDYGFIGGSYLRYSYLNALALGIVCMRAGFQKWSGALLAASALLRVFPVLFYIAILAHDLLNPRRRDLLKKRARFHAAFVLTAIGLLGATSLIDTPSARNPWVLFAESISVHNQKWAANQIGLQYFFFYSHDHNLEAVDSSWPSGERLNWAVEARRTYESRKPLYWISAVLGGLATLSFLRRARANEAFVAGLALVFLSVMASHYYYALLALIPLILPKDARALVALSIAFAIAIAIRLSASLDSIMDLQFLVLNVVVGVLIASLMLMLRLTNDRALSE